MEVDVAATSASVVDTLADVGGATALVGLVGAVDSVGTVVAVPFAGPGGLIAAAVGGVVPAAAG